MPYFQDLIDKIDQLTASATQKKTCFLPDIRSVFDFNFNFLIWLESVD